MMAMAMMFDGCQGRKAARKGEVDLARGSIQTRSMMMMMIMPMMIMIIIMLIVVGLVVIVMVIIRTKVFWTANR